MDSPIKTLLDWNEAGALLRTDAAGLRQLLRDRLRGGIRRTTVTNSSAPQGVA